VTRKWHRSVSTTVELKDQPYRDLQKCRNDRSMAMETFGEKTVLQLVPVNGCAWSAVSVPSVALRVAEVTGTSGGTSSLITSFCTLCA
ncbi:hypothetical protein GBAR_LOCUS1144, partial [Geodia barretti]